MQALFFAPPIITAMTLAVVDQRSVSILRKMGSMDNQTFIRLGAFFVVIITFLGAVVVAATDLIRDPSASLPVGVVSVLTFGLTIATHTLGVNLGSNLGNGNTTTPITVSTPPAQITVSAPMQHTGVGDGTHGTAN